jgi:hypothetical protein
MRLSSPLPRRALAAPTAIAIALALAAPALATPFNHRFSSGPAFAGALTPPATATARTTIFAGSTSPGGTPMVLEVGRSRVARIVTQYSTDCFSYVSVIGSRALRRASVDRKGRFSAKVVTSLVDSPRIFWSGERYPDQIVEQFKGTIGKTATRGTVRATLTFLDGSTCTTGTQRYLMMHKPSRYYGGITSQSLPVSVELSSSGSRIAHLHIGWIARGTGEGLWIVPDFLTNFVLVNGRIDETFAQEYPFPEGGRTKFDYRITAQVGAASATGTLEVTVTEFDATGATTGTWSTSTVRWTARS